MLRIMQIDSELSVNNIISSVIQLGYAYLLTKLNNTTNSHTKYVLRFMKLLSKNYLLNGF